LREGGYDAFLVGGGVRDMLLQLVPKDFDVVTNARPKEIRQLFRNSRLIGRRFRLVHVYFPNEIIEVSTFRTNAEELLKDQPLVENKTKHPEMLLEDNVYGTIEEDAWRRDFTINALYYNDASFTVIDYTGGFQDLKQRLIRMIGDPTQRYHEDPVRLLRAIRLAAKLDFKIHPDTKEPLVRLQHLLRHVPVSRLFDEVLKLFFEGYAYSTYQALMRLGYMHALFPQTTRVLEAEKTPYYSQLIELALHATDKRFANRQPLNPGFLFAVILWPVMQELLREHFQQHHKLFVAVYHGMNTALQEQVKTLMIPRRLTAMIRSMWTLQYHLERRRRNRIYRVLNQRFFRAALDFLQLRARVGEPLNEVVTWWFAFRDGDKERRAQLINELE
jgi:poly(A) polymerase